MSTPAYALGDSLYTTGDSADILGDEGDTYDFWGWADVA